VLSSENSRQIFFSNNKAVILLINPSDGLIIDASQGASQYYGYPLSDLLAMSIFEINTLSRAEIDIEMQRARDESKSHFDFRHRLASGEVHDVEVYSNPVSIEGQKFLFSVIHDVTQRKQAEAALQVSEQQKKLILDTVPDLIWLKDAEGTYLACNQVFERFFGAKEEKIIGKTDYDYVDTDLADSFRYHDKAAMEADLPVRNEEWITYAYDDHQALLETTKVPLKAEDGTVIGILGVGHDITERRKLEEEILNLALTDPLTGLANRNQFHQRFKDAIALAQRQGCMIGLMMLDLDKFKPVNDTYGHPIGDALLIWVADTLQKISRDTDTVARLGGDEFSIIVVNPENRDVLGVLAERVISALSAKVNIMGHDIQIGTSVGIATIPENGDTDIDIMRKADKALYAAKEAGRNIYRFFDPEKDGDGDYQN